MVDDFGRTDPTPGEDAPLADPRVANPGDVTYAPNVAPGQPGDVAARISPTPLKLKPAPSLMDYVRHGLGESVAGLAMRYHTGQGRDRSVPEDADPSFAGNIISQATSTLADLPFMWVGGQLGGAAGGAIGSTFGPEGAAVGGVLGMGAGAGAVPAALRRIYIDGIERGDITSKEDFASRAGAALLDASRDAATNALTLGVGSRVGGVLKPLAGSLLRPPVASFLTGTGRTAAEIATMGSVSAALHGQLPSVDDFINAAVITAGLHGTMATVGATSAKLRNIYAETGTHPGDVLDHMAKDPTIAQDLASTNKPIPDAYRPLQEEPGRKIADMVGEPTPDKKLTWDNIYTKTIDGLNPIKSLEDKLKLQGMDLTASESPYALSRLSRGSDSMAAQFIDNGTFDFATRANNGKSLKQVLAPITDEMGPSGERTNSLGDFRQYAIAARALEMESRGFRSGADVEDAQRIVDAGKTKFQPVLDELVGYQNRLTQYLRDSGLISDEMYGAMTQGNKAYIPFYRLLDDGETGGTSGSGGPRNPIKALSGGDQQIVDPIESIIKNTFAYIRLAERNGAQRALVNLAEQAPGVGEKVSSGAQPIDITPEVRKFAEENNIDPEQVGQILAFRKTMLGAQGDDQIAVYRDGKREVWRVDPDIAAAFSTLDPQTAGPVVGLLSKFATALRTGTTLNPAFVLKNFLRDQIHAGVFSENGYRPVVDFISGMSSVLTKDGSLQNWLKSGAGQSALYSLDRDYIQNHVFDLNTSTNWRSATWNAVTTPIDWMRAFGESVENATRVGEFKRGIAAGDDIRGAGFGSREVTVDFARRGSDPAVQGWAKMTAFGNAQLQGVDRVIRGLKDDPAGVSFKIGASVVLPSIALYLMNKDQDWYKETPDWQKDTFWLFKSGDTIYRLPKPQEVGTIFGSGTERTLALFEQQDPAGFNKWASSVAGVLMPNVTPTFAAPIVSHATNWDTFLDRPVVPHSMENILPAYQAAPYTSVLTQTLGRYLGQMPIVGQTNLASPIHMEHDIRAWGGTLGDLAIKLASRGLEEAGVVSKATPPQEKMDAALGEAQALPESPMHSGVDISLSNGAATLAANAFVKSFQVRYPDAQAESIQQFYDRYTEKKKTLATYKYLTQSGDTDAAEALRQANPDADVHLDGIEKSISKMHKVITLLTANPALPVDEKRQLIDRCYWNMIQAARAGNAEMDSVEQSTKPH